METKPIIKLIPSPVDNTLELASKIFLLVLWALAVFALIKLPTTIPIHFNAAGQADNYGNKAALLILPVLATVIYIGISQLNKYPHIFNYMTKITEDNAQKQYTLATRMLRFLKLTVLLIFSVIILFTYLTTIGVVKGLGFWFLPLTIGIFIVPTIIMIILSLKK